MSLIKRIWNGELPLVKVYWIYGILIGFISVVFIQLFKDSHTSIILITLALIPYQILVLVGIWRSANNYNNKKLWAVLAKVHVIFSAIIQISGVVAVVNLISFDSYHKLTNCVRCEDGKCEPSTSIRSAEVKLLPNENQMKASLELWTKDKNGNFEKAEEVDLDMSIKGSKLKCAIKSDNDGFCSFEHDPLKIADIISYQKETFVFDGKKYSHIYNYHYIFKNNDEKKSTTEYSCS